MTGRSICSVDVQKLLLTIWSNTAKINTLLILYYLQLSTCTDILGKELSRSAKILPWNSFLFMCAFVSWRSFHAQNFAISLRYLYTMSVLVAWERYCRIIISSDFVHKIVIVSDTPFKNNSILPKYVALLHI